MPNYATKTEEIEKKPGKIEENLQNSENYMFKSTKAVLVVNLEVSGGLMWVFRGAREALGGCLEFVVF